MGFYKFIKFKGKDAKYTGYFVPGLHHLAFSWRELKVFGFQFVKERLAGWTIWWVSNEEDYIQAKKTIKELRKTRIFDFSVSE